MAKIKDRTGETNINHQGLSMKIIEYKNWENINVEFDDGFISKNKTYQSFKNGQIRNHNHAWVIKKRFDEKDKIGEKSLSTEGFEMEIIGYRNSRDIDIMFSNGYILKNAEYGNFKKGSLRNLYYPSVYGVGYIGEGKYCILNNGKPTPQYSLWHGVLARCYDKIYQEKRPTYKNCKLYEEWRCLQEFGKWYDNNYYEIDNERMEIDKDILFKRNKFYSPDTCIFVPKRINSLFTKCDSVRGEFPIGVSYNKICNNFRVRLDKIKTQIHLGYFNTPEEAFYAYKSAKEKYIKEVADEYKDRIPQKLYDAMYVYEVEITD